MQELKFIKYLIGLSNKYNSDNHKYFPDKDLRDSYNLNLCKKFSLNPNMIINIEINLLKNFDLVIDELNQKVKICFMSQ